MSKKLKRSAVALVLAATMVFSSQGVLTAFAAGENKTSTAVDVLALEPSQITEGTDVADESGDISETETPEVTEPCDKTEGCTLSKDHEGECQVTPVDPPVENENGEGETQPCTKTEGCTLENGHEGECVTEPVTPPEEENGEGETKPCEKTEGCTLPNGHEGECVVEENTEDTEDTQEPSEEDVAAAKNVSDLIGALPEASTLDPETTDVEALTAQVKAAREAYDKLTDAQKALVEKAVLDKLVALEGALEGLQQVETVPEESTVAMIGTDKYTSLNDAIKNAASDDTILLTKDCNLSSVTIPADKTITIDGGEQKHKITAENTQIAFLGNLTFKNCELSMTGTPSGADPNWMYLYTGSAGNSSITFIDSTVVIDGSDASKNMTAFYFPEPRCSASHLTLTRSSMTIRNCLGNGISWGGSVTNGYNTITIEESTLNIDGADSATTSGGGGIIGTFDITVTNSNLNVKNCGGYGSNGSHFTITNSDVNFSNNTSHGLSAGNLIIENSDIVTNDNGMFGITYTGKMSMDDTSTIDCERNALEKSGGGIRANNAGNTSTVDAGAIVDIKDNGHNGLENYGNFTFEEGAIVTITGNDERTTNGGGIFNDGTLNLSSKTIIMNNHAFQTGGGICNAGTVTIPAGVQLYNNHAGDAGDDIYNRENATITFGKVGSDWKLDGAPDCNHAITGWFDDSEGNRWEAHDAPLHVSEFTNFNDAGIATISGLTALKAAHPYLTPEIEPGDPDVPSSDWPISKSKTAENLDENFESKVTLSLPADSYKPSVDVVMVMDVSSSMKGEDITEAKAAATAMCDELASKTNANVNIGIVTFDKEARNLTNGLVSIEEAKNAINNIKASEDTNMMAGLIAGKAMLDAGTATDKYLVIMSDGIPIYWVENGETISKTLIRYKQDKVTEIDRLPAGSEPEGSAPEDFDSMLSIKQLLNITDWDTDSNEWKQVSDTGENINPDCKYTNIQKATYKTAQYMIDNIFGQYKIKMVAFGTDKYENNVVYKYGENLCDWIGDQDGVSYYKVSKPNYGGEAGDLVEAFTDIANEMIYLVDAGSQVVDEIGFGTYEDGTEYDFDFVNEISKLELTVGGKALDKVQIDDYTYGFGPDSTLPKDYQFIVTYYPNGLTRSVAGELFVWDIYVPITIDDKVQLTYSVKLNDPRTDDGEYGIYDPDGSANRNGLYTNNAAVLYPVDSNGNNGEPEAFDKPTVSYTVSNGKPVEPTPDPDPDPDRPSRPNRDDDDDWEPLPDAPVKDKPTTEVDVPEETETPTTEQPDKYNPETGDTTTVFAAMALAAVSLGGVVLLGRKKK